MTREMIAAAVLVWVIGALVGWFAGWVARGDENRRWADSVRRRIDLAENQVAELTAELAQVEAQRLPEPAVAMPAIHVHVETSGVLGYRDLAAAAALAMAERPMPPVLEVGP
jgi:hypothetical protein